MTKNSTRLFPILSIIFLLFTIGVYFFAKDNNFNNNNVTVLENGIDEKIVKNDEGSFDIKIKKIDVSAPVISEVDGTKKDEYNEKLKNGVAHLKETSFPGEDNNIFIFGHSSSEIGEGLYSDIFKDLNIIENKDEIIISYQNKKYYYSVFDKEVINKEDIGITRPTASERLTLMTCWPIGTDEKRLMVKARLVNVLED